MKSGMCLAGWHEGTKPRTREGKPIKTCDCLGYCTCQCHIDLDEMFALTEKPRELIVNPDYKPVIGQHLVQPTIIMPGLLSGETVEVGANVSPAPGMVPAQKVKQFEPTESGRIAKGQLEYWVKDACDVWVIEYSDQDERRVPPCTPEWIAEQIGLAEKMAPPQLGGINHVFRRWQEIGIAIIAEKPARFVGYTPEVIDKGMDWMRDRAKSKVGAF